jgi:hypothetical protein
MAAVLACGEGAVLSHRSAAVCWCCADREDLVPHVTAPHRVRPAGVVAHRGRLAPADVTVRNGIPVTSAARTLVDLAQLLSEEDLERVVREAQFRGLFHEHAIRDAPQRRPSTLLRQLLTTATRASPSSRTDSCVCAAGTASRGRKPRSATAAGGRTSSGLTHG